MNERREADLLRSAMKASAEGMHEVAVELFTEALSEAGDSAILHYNLALELAACGKRREARKSLAKAAELDREDSDALAELGRLEIDDKRLASAVHSLDEALERNPNHPAALNNRGVAAFLKGRFAEAVDFFSRAVTADAASRDAWFNLADALEETGDKERAAEARHRYRELER